MTKPPNLSNMSGLKFGGGCLGNGSGLFENALDAAARPQARYCQQHEEAHAIPETDILPGRCDVVGEVWDEQPPTEPAAHE